MNEINLLKEEYLKVIDIVSAYDGYLMIIKGWSITVGLALIGYAVKEKQRSLLIACMIGAIAFTFVDAKFKEYQVAYYPRMSAVEQCMISKQADPNTKCVVFSVHTSWQHAKEWYGIILQLFKLGVLIPHIFIFFLAAYLYRRLDLR